MKKKVGGEECRERERERGIVERTEGEEKDVNKRKIKY